MKVFMAHAGTGCFEGGQSRAILAVGRIWLVGAFVELGEGVLCLPLQKNGADLVPLDSLECLFGPSSVSATGRNLPLHQQWKKFVEMVSTLLRDVKSLPGILACHLQIAGLQGESRQHTQGVVDVLLPVDLLLDCQRPPERAFSKRVVACVHVDVASVCQPHSLIDEVSQFTCVLPSFEKQFQCLLRVSQAVGSPSDVALSYQ